MFITTCLFTTDVYCFDECRKSKKTYLYYSYSLTIQNKNKHVNPIYDQKSTGLKKIIKFLFIGYLELYYINIFNIVYLESLSTQTILTQIAQAHRTCPFSHSCFGYSVKVKYFFYGTLYDTVRYEAAGRSAASD
jgi:hypothetical protein